MRSASVLAVLAMACLAGQAQAQVPAANQAGAAPAAAAPPAGNPADTAAIRELLDRFADAYGKGDAQSVAATFSPDAIVVDEDGTRIEGREAIAARFAQSFADDPGSTIRLEVDVLRFLSPDTAIEEGHATVNRPGSAEPEHSRYTAVHVRLNGQWLQGLVRDHASEAELTAHDRLLELEWLVGEWLNESDSSVVRTSCKWSDDGNFLLRDFTMKVRGDSVLSGTQRIGWDPVRRQFKMWVFDSEGGFGEGYFFHDGDRWMVKAEGTRQDGKHASVTTVLTRLGKDRIGWQSIHRTMQDEAVPGLDEFTLVRQPPEVAR